MLTISNKGDETLLNIQWFSSGIAFNSNPQILMPGQSIMIEGTKTFSGCSDSNFVSVTATTLGGDFIAPPPAMSEFIAPSITSVIFGKSKYCC